MYFPAAFLLPPYTDGTKRYKRLNMEIADADSQMDNVTDENMNKLVDIGNKYVQDNKDELLKICEIIA